MVALHSRHDAEDNESSSCFVSTFGDALSWAVTYEPRFSLLALLVTMMPVAAEMICAGSWDTRPWPTVRREYLCMLRGRQSLLQHADSEAADEVEGHDDESAMASPFTNFEERPSRRRCRPRSRSPGGAAGFLLRDGAGVQVCVDGHMLAGHRVQSDLAATSATLSAPW
jgi:hypothetical protein